MTIEKVDEFKDITKGNGSSEDPFALVEGKGGHLRMLKGVAERWGQSLAYGYAVFITLETLDNRYTFSVGKKIGGWEWIPGPVDLRLVRTKGSGKFSEDEVKRIVGYTKDIIQTFSPVLQEK